MGEADARMILTANFKLGDQLSRDPSGVADQSLLSKRSRIWPEVVCQPGGGANVVIGVPLPAARSLAHPGAELSQ
jgi:hypothetical protein